MKLGQNTNSTSELLFCAKRKQVSTQSGAFLEQTAHWSSLGETVAKQSRGLKQLTEEYLRPMVFEIDFLSIGKSANTRFNRPV
jgi:hypothetical protein